MKDLQQKLVAMFRVESKEHVEAIRASLAKLEGAEAKGELEEAFRRAHSLKGAARAVGYRDVETISHRLETAFSRVREGRLVLGAAGRIVIERVLDGIEDLVTGTKRPATGQRPSASALADIQALLGEEPEEPSPAPSAPALSFPGSETRKIDTVRVSTESLDRLSRSIGQLSVETLRHSEVERELSGLVKDLAAIKKSVEQVRRSSRSKRSLEHDLGNLESQVRSLSRQASAVRRLQQRSNRSSHILAEHLQDELREARMVPAQSLLEGFGKMVRELAHQAGKEIDFRATGLEVRADREVLETLKDGLMHLLRNAVSHGIEPPGDRRAQGKSPVGQIRLEMKSEANRLRVAVEDDGRGLETERIVETAARLGLGEPSVLRTLPPTQLYDFLFQPGFSTTSGVSVLAGRGMGLSVVAETVSRLRGEVMVEPGPISGTSFRISLPLTASAQRVLLVTCRDETFGIPVDGVEKVLRVSQQEIKMVEGRATLTVGGKATPLLSLSYLLGTNGAVTLSHGGGLPVVVLHSEKRRGAVAVESFLGELEGVIRHLGPRFSHLRGLAGGLVLADGTVSLVLNPSELIDRLYKSNGSPVRQEIQPRQQEHQPLILVVDDSITTRTLEKSILEAHGYRVGVAVDGVEALTRLRAESFDLVIADIQMPRLDGFALLEALKKDRRLSDIPVIIVSSMESREEQERGLSLGADAYIGKGKFDQRNLLDTIRKVL